MNNVYSSGPGLSGACLSGLKLIILVCLNINMGESFQVQHFEGYFHRKHIQVVNGSITINHQ